MSEPEISHLLERVRELEQSNRRWKAVAVGLGVLCALIITLGGAASLVGAWGMTAARTEAMRAMEAARAAEMQARDVAEKQRRIAEQKLQEARLAEKKLKEHVYRLNKEKKDFKLKSEENDKKQKNEVKDLKEKIINFEDQIKFILQHFKKLEENKKIDPEDSIKLLSSIKKMKISEFKGEIQFEEISQIPKLEDKSLSLETKNQINRPIYL